MFKVYGRLTCRRGRRAYLGTVFKEDAERIKAEGVYRTYRGDYKDLIFKAID